MFKASANLLDRSEGRRQAIRLAVAKGITFEDFWRRVSTRWYPEGPTEQDARTAQRVYSAAQRAKNASGLIVNRQSIGNVPASTREKRYHSRLHLQPVPLGKRAYVADLLHRLLDVPIREARAATQKGLVLDGDWAKLRDIHQLIQNLAPGCAALLVGLHAT